MTECAEVSLIGEEFARTEAGLGGLPALWSHVASVWISTPRHHFIRHTFARHDIELFIIAIKSERISHDTLPLKVCKCHLIELCGNGTRQFETNTFEKSFSWPPREQFENFILISYYFQYNLYTYLQSNIHCLSLFPIKTQSALYLTRQASPKCWSTLRAISSHHNIFTVNNRKKTQALIFTSKQRQKRIILTLTPDAGSNARETPPSREGYEKRKNSSIFYFFASRSITEYIAVCEPSHIILGRPFPG